MAFFFSKWGGGRNGKENGYKHEAVSQKQNGVQAEVPLEFCSFD